jgi:uncharacterized protein
LSPVVVVAINGLALGLASTLHCAGMCGAISSSLSLCTPLAPQQRPASSFWMIHAGRISAYALAGILVAAAGAPAIAWLDREIAFRILQWAGAIALMWIGLATAGLMPSFALLDRYMLALADRVARFIPAAGNGAAQPFVAGLAWGLMPCAMVYGALFTAMLSGSAVSGGVIMLAFGAGTLPGLVATTYGVHALRRLSDRRIGREFAGLTIALLGFLSVFIVNPAIRNLCLSSAGSSQTLNSNQSSLAEISLDKSR